MTAAPLARVGAKDEFGIVTEAAKRRALYGERVAHGKAGCLFSLPVAATSNPFVRPAPIRRPEPAKPPQSKRGRNQHTREADRGLGEAIKAAGEARISELPPRSRERHLTRQSTMFLCYTMASMIMVDISEMFGSASGDHGMARMAIKAARERMNHPGRARDEADRQGFIKALIRKGRA